MADFVHAFDAAGNERLVPAHWLDHPVLGAGLSLERPEAASGQDDPTSGPDPDKPKPNRRNRS